MATGCVKIVKRAKEFDEHTGKFIPEEKRAKSVDLFKGRITLMLAQSLSGQYGAWREKFRGKKLILKCQVYISQIIGSFFLKSLKQC